MSEADEEMLIATLGMDYECPIQNLRISHESQNSIIENASERLESYDDNNVVKHILGLVGCDDLLIDVVLHEIHTRKTHPQPSTIQEEPDIDKSVLISIVKSYKESNMTLDEAAIEIVQHISTNNSLSQSPQADISGHKGNHFYMPRQPPHPHHTRFHGRYHKPFSCCFFCPRREDF